MPITLSITSAGIPWSASELARISVAFVGGDDAPIEITDEQIRRMRRAFLGMPVKSEENNRLIDDCTVALTDRRAMAFRMAGVAEGIAKARTRCAAVYNALHGSHP